MFFIWYLYIYSLFIKTKQKKKLFEEFSTNSKLLKVAFNCTSVLSEVFTKFVILTKKVDQKNQYELNISWNKQNFVQ